MLDLSGQAILYELATVVYMVSLFWGHTLHAGLAPLMAWGVTKEGRAVTLRAISVLRDPPGPSVPIQVWNLLGQLLHRW